MSENVTRLALLIDSDNVSATRARDIIDELATYGTLTVRRAYGDWSSNQLGRWRDELHPNAITPIQQFANTKGKNATDSALIIDAMDLLYSGHLDGFVIVSSDSDFTRLATRLRESGKVVYGVGARKTPRAFSEACDRFIYLENLGGAAEPEEQLDEPTATEPREVEDVNSPRLRSRVDKALHATSGDDGWSPLPALGQQLQKSDSTFDPRTYGFAKLSDLMTHLPYVDIKWDGGRPGSGRVWVKQTGKRAPAKKAASKTAAAPRRAAKKSTD